MRRLLGRELLGPECRAAGILPGILAASWCCSGPPIKRPGGGFGRLHDGDAKNMTSGPWWPSLLARTSSC